MRRKTVLIVVLALALAPLAYAHGGHDHKVLGTVTMAAADHVMLKDKDGKDVTIQVTKDTKVKSKPAMKVEAIKPGTRVVVTASMEKDKTLKAQNDRSRRGADGDEVTVMTEHGNVMTKTNLFLAALVLAAPSLATAHVSVRPRESRPGAEERYTVRVPTEGAVATTHVQLEIPPGVTVLEVLPHEGATFETIRQGNRIVAITWKKEIPPKSIGRVRLSRA